MGSRRGDSQEDFGLPLLTNELSEARTRIRYDDGHARALAFDAIIQELTRRRHLTVPWVNPPIHEPDGTRMMAVDVVSRPAFRVGRPRLLFKSAAEFPADLSPVSRYDVTPDGRKFLMVQTNDETVVRRLSSTWLGPPARWTLSAYFAKCSS